jgi:hypothetical protein
MNRVPNAAAGCLLAFLLGCAPSWRVVTEASPSPLSGQGRIGVAPIDYSGVRAGKGTEAANLGDDEASLEENFVAALRAKARAGGIHVERADDASGVPFLIRPSVSLLDGGRASSRVEMDVKIVAADGRVLDEITLAHRSVEAKSGSLVGDDGEALGALVARYLRERVGKVTEALPAEGDEPEAPPRPRPRAAAPAAPPPLHEPEPVAEAAHTPPAPVAGPGRRPGGRRDKAVPPPAPRKGWQRPAPVVLPAPPPGAPVASPPSFTRQDDGTSRIFMEVTRRVPVVETRSRARVVYLIRGAVLLQATTQLPLPTGFFTTPVERVQLVTAGPDVALVIDLREDVAPAHQEIDTPRGMVIQVDFPRSLAFHKDDGRPEPVRPRATRPAGTRTLGPGATPGSVPEEE